MCSNREEAIPMQRNQLTGDLQCVKCRRDVPVVVTRVNDAFCQECFLSYAIHKFRSAIGKSKVIVAKEHVLVACSGGEASLALLHFLQEGIKEGKLRFTVAVVHIDELSLTSLPDEERKAKVTDVAKCVLDRGFPLFLTSIEDVMSIGGEEENPTSREPLSREVATCAEVRDLCGRHSSEQLQDVLASLPSISAREEFLRVSRNQLLVAIARQRGFTKVVVGDTATALAVRIMTNMAKGKGNQVSLDTGIGDDRYRDVMMVRPLRELNMKEVEAYNRLQGLEAVSLPNIRDKWHRGNSIEQLTSSFVLGLQQDFPSTVPNIVRTGGKLSQGEDKALQAKCSMCQSPLDTNVGEASALRAVEASERLSQARSAKVKTDPPEDDTSDSLTVAGLKSSLCYGCRLMTKGLSDTSLLPPQVTAQAKTRCRELMRAQISDFLLEEDSCNT